jgi:DNA polymerase III sliding clamp (beta) subunit (PCNA family)
MFTVKVRRDELARAVNQCSSVVAKRSTIEIILKILLTAEDDQLILTATDLEVTLQTRIPAEVTGSGDVVIRPMTLSEFLKSCSGEHVIMHLSENFTLTTDCGGFKVSHFGLSSEDFPKASRPEDAEFVKIETKALIDAIDKTIYSVTQEETLYNLKGVAFIREEVAEKIEDPAPAGDDLDEDGPGRDDPGLDDPDRGAPDRGSPDGEAPAKWYQAKEAQGPGEDQAPDGQEEASRTPRPERLRLVSTDAQRLNVATIEADDLRIFPQTGNVLVPRKGLQELKALCEPYVYIDLGLLDNSLVAKTDDSLLKIRLLSGLFPDYQAIIPPDANLEIWVKRVDLLNTVKRFSFLIDSNYHLSKFVFNRDLLTISSMNPELGQAEDSVGIEYHGPEVATRFNPNYFVDVLSSLKSERVCLRFSEENPSYMVTAPDDPGFSGVIVSVSYDVI